MASSIFILFDIRIFANYLRMRRKHGRSLRNWEDVISVADQCICALCFVWYLYFSHFHICSLFEDEEETWKQPGKLGRFDQCGWSIYLCEVYMYLLVVWWIFVYLDIIWRWRGNVEAAWETREMWSVHVGRDRPARLTISICIFVFLSKTICDK